MHSAFFREVGTTPYGEGSLSISYQFSVQYAIAIVRVRDIANGDPRFGLLIFDVTFLPQRVGVPRVVKDRDNMKARC